MRCTTARPPVERQRRHLRPQVYWRISLLVDKPSLAQRRVGSHAVRSNFDSTLTCLLLRQVVSESEEETAKS